MSSRSNQLKDDILNQIADQIKGLQLSQQTALDEGITNFQVTANNIHLQCLLDLIDHLLLHGLEKIEFGYWPFVKELTHSETVKHIVNHPQVTTDLDKGRVWIHTAFSDGLLESYIRLFADGQKLAKKFYTRKAFVRDKERLAVLQTLVSGLDFISIVLDQGWPYLGYGTQHFQDSGFDDGKSQTTFACSNSAEAVDNTSSDERDDNNTIASNSLSNSSTLYVAEPLSPINHASITEPLGPNSNASVIEPLTPKNHALIKELLETNNKVSSGSHEQHQKENVIDYKQEVLQTMDVAKGSSEIHDIVKHETQVCEEGVIGAEKQQAQSRLQLGTNFQTDQFAEDENFHFDPIKIKSRRHKTRRRNEIKLEKCDKGKDNFEVNPFVCVGGHSLETSMDEVQYGSFEELEKEKSYEELLQLSRSEQSSFQSQDSYPGCSSPTSSLQSTDSLDQFCKDLESSFNLTSEKSLNFPTLQLCDNKGWSELGDAEINKEQGFSIDDSLVLTTSNSTDNTDQGSSNVDTSSNYEGIILGLPKRPLLQQLPVTSCDVSVDQNTMLALSLEVFEKNGEQFHRMLVLMCGHLSSQLYFLHVLLTDHAIYLMRKVPSHEGKNFQVHLAFPFTTLKKIEVGLNCQTVTLASKSQKCVLFVADEAVSRDVLSSLTSMIVKSGHGSLLSKIVSTSTFQQESLIKKWICENVQSCSMDIRCYTIVQWCGLSGPDANIEVLSHKSVKEGYMDCKPPQNLRRTYKWTTSYFVLKNGILFQHVDQGDQVGKVVVKLRGSRCGGCRRVNDSERSHAFEIVAEDGSPLILLAAFSEDSAADWIFRLCQAVAETCDSEDEMSGTVMHCVPCCLILTNVKIVACLPNPTTEETFELLSECSVESVTRLFLDNDVRNYCILGFERSELAGTESSWFVWFKTEYELAKFERGLLQAWQELFQIDLQFLVLGEGSMRAVARQKAKNIEDLYKSHMA